MDIHVHMCVRVSLIKQTEQKIFNQTFLTNSHFFVSLHAITTYAPLFANSSAVSFPIPVFDPVIITTFWSIRLDPSYFLPPI